MSQEQRPSRIPNFASREEEAEFWDTHDLTDYWDETRPVEITVSDELRARVAARANNMPAERLTVDLDRADRQELARRAEERGIGASMLVTLWIEERLRAERTAG